MITQIHRDTFDVVVGGATCRLYDYKSHLYISSVYTEPQERGKGFASQMMQEIVDFAKATNQKVQLEVGAFYRDAPATLNNDQLLAFYGKFGFQKTRGTRMEYDPCQQ